MTVLKMLTWSLRLDGALLFRVPHLSLFAKLRLIVLKYGAFLKGCLPGKGGHSCVIFGARFCYNERLGPASLQRVYCADHTLRNLLPDAPVILDVGANIGQFHFFSRHYLGARRIVSIEPEQGCFRLLKENALDSGDCLNCAASDREGELLFHVADATQLSSSIADPEGTYLESYTVTARGLDAIADEMGLHRVDLLKIDTEGSEFDVLKSAERLLARTQFVLVEMSVFRECAGNLFRIGSFLEERGFVLAELSGAAGRRPRDMDALFRRA